MARKQSFKRIVEKLCKTLPDLTEHQKRVAIASVDDWKSTKRTFIGYWQMMQVYKGYQVVRTFTIRIFNYKRKENPEPYIEQEVMQVWLAPGGDIVWRCCPCQWWGGYYDAWFRSSDMRVCPVPTNTGYGYYESKPYSRYEKIVLSDIYVSSCLPVFKYCGFTKEGVIRKFKHSWNTMQTMMIDPIVETLYRSGKAEDKRMFNKVNEVKVENAKRYIAAYKVCRRHKYKITDLSLWCDMVDALAYLKLDLHNPFYVCPADLKRAHDIYVGRMTKKQDAQELEKAIKQAYKHENLYAKMHGVHVGIELHSSDFDIVVCPSVTEMAMEGKAMHHCVFANGYYKKASSLILFVRGKEGNRIRTIELNTDTWRIVQNRGVNNSVPMYCKEANRLVMDNIDTFKQPFKQPIQLELPFEEFANAA